MHRLEDPLEQVFLRIDPTLPEQWKGATEEQIDAIEGIAGRPLPEFYRWFLQRMGEDMGTMAYDIVDFSAETILAIYEHGHVTSDGRHLLIGYNEDDIMPVHIFYDLDRPARGDCMVGQMEFGDSVPQVTFETFREMIGWGNFTNRSVRMKPQVCSGLMSVADGLVRPHVDEVMKDLGFSNLLPSGPFCSLHERGDVTMSYTGAPRLAPKMLVFNVGGPDEGTLRRILGAFTVSGYLSVDVDEWKPPLPSSAS
jgi:hypothetical protein